MSKYSRTRKYEDLRNRLEHEVEQDLQTNDLAHFEQRLNNINARNFEAPQPTKTAEEHDPIHSRRNQGFETKEMKPIEPKVEQAFEPAYIQTARKNNENYNTAVFQNDYLNEYINEVKRYNIDQGNAFSQNTEVNILRSLRGDQVEKVEKPYPNEPVEDLIAATLIKDANTINNLKKQEEAYYEEEPVVEEEIEQTADIPFFNSKRSDDLFNDFMGLNEESTTGSLRSKEDIAKEVQSLIAGNPMEDTRPSSLLEDSDYDSYTMDDRTTNQRLLNETTQMRAQLDDYEDNLMEVNDKMNHQNKVMNTVLIVLIIALTIVLGVVVYWVLKSKGLF